MRSEFFKSMNVNKQRFIDEIKSGKNPNYLIKEVEEERKKTEEAAIIVVEQPLLQPVTEPILQVARVYHEKKRESITERLGIARRAVYVKNRFRERFRVNENFLKRLNEWFEVAWA